MELNGKWSLAGEGLIADLAIGRCGIPFPGITEGREGFWTKRRQYGNYPETGL